MHLGLIKSEYLLMFWHGCIVSWMGEGYAFGVHQVRVLFNNVHQVRVLFINVLAWMCSIMDGGGICFWGHQVRVFMTILAWMCSFMDGRVICFWGLSCQNIKLVFWHLMNCANKA